MELRTCIRGTNCPDVTELRRFLGLGTLSVKTGKVPDDPEEMITLT